MTAVLIGGIVVLDQCVKYFISHRFILHESRALVQGVVHLTLVHNKGAAFGIFSNQVPIFIIVSCVALVLIAFQLYRLRAETLNVRTIGYSLMFAGALGNVIDRVRVGYVIDFIDLRVWPVFNIADCAISVGAAILVVHYMRRKKI